MVGSLALVYDAGALVAADRGRRDFWALHRRALARRSEPIVPAPVLAQAWRGGPKQAMLARALHGCRLLPFTPADAYDVGLLLAAAGTSDIVDSAVVLTAAARGAAVVTSDPNDLTRLADTLGAELVLHTL